MFTMQMYVFYSVFTMPVQQTYMFLRAYLGFNNCEKNKVLAKTMVFTVRVMSVKQVVHRCVKTRIFILRTANTYRKTRIISSTTTRIHR